jgi:hypothetical protein
MLSSLRVLTKVFFPKPSTGRVLRLIVPQGLRQAYDDIPPLFCATVLIRDRLLGIQARIQKTRVINSDKKKFSGGEDKFLS